MTTRSITGFSKEFGVTGFTPMLGLSWMLRAFSTYRQRVQLARLEPHMLRDIGLTDAAADAEVKRSFWDLPRN